MRKYINLSLINRYIWDLLILRNINIIPYINIYAYINNTHILIKGIRIRKGWGRGVGGATKKPYVVYVGYTSYIPFLKTG